MGRETLGQVLAGGTEKVISVIVPAYNEEELLPRCLESIIQQQEACQLIIVDGASEDSTLQVAQRYADRVIILDEPGLARQLNAGAEAASGDILLFLHADSLLVPGCLARLKCLPEKFVGGAFTMHVAGNRFFFRLLSLGGDVFCRLSGIYFGDRGIFIRTKIFKQMGGFVELPIMADVDFSQRLKSQGKTILLPGPVVSSSRKFEKESPWRTLYLIFYALIAFKLKVDPEKIKAKYYGENQANPKD